MHLIERLQDILGIGEVGIKPKILTLQVLNGKLGHTKMEREMYIGQVMILRTGNINKVQEYMEKDLQKEQTILYQLIKKEIMKIKEQIILTQRGKTGIIN
ncbi:hypothetical protein IX329_002526 [Fusobacterium necrophorum]|nr:hypothetical protein [Fusobacterium necrophorum]MBR8791087.1 hypothetical protein [Fusobacterium necrophorum]MBR8823994.1 hypothetical protein [Fusobacterium necrophorum]